MGSDNSISAGGGYNNNNAKNKFTYLGDYAGQASGPYEQMLNNQFEQAARSGSEADYLFGGKDYGLSKGQWGTGAIQPNPVGTGGGGGGREKPQSRALVAQQSYGGGGKPNPIGDDPGGHFGDNWPINDPGDGGGGPGWDYGGDPYGDGSGDLGGGGNGGGSSFGGDMGDDGRGGDGGRGKGGHGANTGTLGAAPTGGLVGAFQDIYSNPATQKDNDITGVLNWMASGTPTDAEQAVDWRYRNIANNPASQYEQGVQSGYQGFATGQGPNAARDAALYGGFGSYGTSTGKYDPSMGEGYSDLAKAGPQGYEQTAGDVYQTMATHGGYTPEQQNDMMVAAQQAARSGADAARDEMTRTAAATGNQAGLYGGLAQVQRNQGAQQADAARQVRMAAANEAIRQREAGAAGAAGLQNEITGRRATGLGGLQGVQQGLDTRQRFGLSGQSELANQGNQNALAGLGGGAAMGANLGSRQLAGIGGMMQGNQNLRQYQQTGAGMSMQQQSDLFGRRMQGLGGLGQLYQSAVNRQLGQQGQFGEMGGKPREIYGEGGAANAGITL